jgi:hypothetical protein
MTENDNSWSQEDDSWRKTTSHVEMVGWQAGFFAQSSVLSTHYLSIDPDTRHLKPVLLKKKIDNSDPYFVN